MLYTTTSKWKLILLLIFNSNRVKDGFIYVSDLSLLTSLKGLNYHLLYQVKDTQANLDISGGKDNLSIQLVRTEKQ